MKALVKTKLKAKELHIMDIPIPEPKENEVRIKVLAVGVCGTDMHLYKGEIKHKIPVTIGHEFCGVVEKLGLKSSKVKIGDKVVCMLHAGVCGVCRHCLTGSPHICKRRTCPGVLMDGANAEFIVINENLLIKIADDISPEEATLSEPLAIVATCLLHRAKLEAEDFVVIYGPGPIGLIALQLCKVYGARKVVMVGTDVDATVRLPLAEKLGADLVLNSQKDNINMTIAGLTDGNGADLIVECSGAGSAVNNGIEVVRRDGRICVIGVPGREEILVKWKTLVEKSIQVIPTYSGAPIGWLTAISMINRKIFDAKSLITHKLPIEEYETMFTEIEKGNVVKGVFML